MQRTHSRRWETTPAGSHGSSSRVRASSIPPRRCFVHIRIHYTAYFGGSVVCLAQVWSTSRRKTPHSPRAKVRPQPERPTVVVSSSALGHLLTTACPRLQAMLCLRLSTPLSATVCLPQSTRTRAFCRPSTRPRSPRATRTTWRSQRRTRPRRAAATGTRSSSRPGRRV